MLLGKRGGEQEQREGRERGGRGRKQKRKMEREEGGKRGGGSCQGGARGRVVGRGGDRR